MLLLINRFVSHLSVLGSCSLTSLSRRCYQALPSHLLRRAGGNLALSLVVACWILGMNGASAQALSSSDVVAWVDRGYDVPGEPYTDYGQAAAPLGLSAATALAAGGWHSMALMSNGTVVAWGRNDYGQINIPTGLPGVRAIAAGGKHSMVLKSDGTVAAWGDNSSGQNSIPDGLSGVTAIAAGGFHSMALKNDGTVVTWGSDDYGQINVPVGLSGVTAIAAGRYHSMALKGDGTVVTWGYTIDYFMKPRPSVLGRVTAIAAGVFHSMALQSDGTVAEWGYSPRDVPAGLSGVTAISGGAYRSLALKSDGTVVSWYRGYGETPNGGTIPAGLSGVTAIATGYYHDLAIKATDTTPPVVSSVAPAQNARYLIQQRVTVNYSCTDPSTVTLCSGSLPMGAHLDTSRLGEKTFIVTATDGQGNTGSTLINYTIQAQPTTLPPTTLPRRR